MELHRDVMFKRNIHGYVEEARVQVWLTHIRQIPMVIVYHPHNQEHELESVMTHGLHFLSMGGAIQHIRKAYAAFQEDTDFFVSPDVCHDALEALRLSKPDVDGDMYRVVYRSPLTEIKDVAIGCGSDDINEVRFVSTETDPIGHWCIYNKNIAEAVANLNSTASFDGYIYRRLRDNPDGGLFVIQSTPYNPDGNPKEGNDWVDVKSVPHWNRGIRFVMAEDLRTLKSM